MIKKHFSKELLEIVLFDIYVTLNVRNLTGKEYSVILIMNFSKYINVFRINMLEKVQN